MPMKRSYEGGNCIGNTGSVNGSSIQMNNQRNIGGEKPSASGGNSNPGDTKPMRVNESPMPVPMPR